jgi:hypothetical protein
MKMKNLKLMMMTLMMSFVFLSCEKENSEPTNCGSYNGKPTYKGPQGVCYYINSNNNKTYVDGQYCPC